MGALMLSIDCHHPDLEEFIGIKSDLDRVTKANISVRITDDFMIAVKNHEDFELSFTREETGETIKKIVNAYELFKKFSEMNWDYAEPGMLFWDRIENWNLLSEDDSFKYAGVNPCFGGQAELLTVDGYKTFESLVDTEPYIINVNGNVVKSRVWCSGTKNTVKVKLGNNEIICTPDHRFMTIDGKECMAKDLKGKYLMPCTKANIKFDNHFVKLGFIQGDGQLKNIYNDFLEVNIGEKDTDIFDLFSDENYKTYSNRSILVSGYTNEIENLGFSRKTLIDRVFPSTYSSWSHIQKASFLHGCYSANGSVIANGRIAYKTTCRKFAEQMVETLDNDFGISSAYITTNKPKKIQFPNGEYVTRESYDINICKFKDITKFILQINFYQQYKREQLEMMMKKRAPYVLNVEPWKEIAVYDFTEPERHWGIVEGYVVHNCAEEPLPAGGSCLLGSINLSEFVTEDKNFNFDDFEDTVSIAVRALNDVLDEGLPLHPLQEQIDSVRDWRQIGLGIMGLADCLIKLGIRYGSDEAIDICDDIGFSMADTAIKTSALLAREKGAYPKYNKSVKSSRYYMNNVTMDTDCYVENYGLHNSQLLTTAPTGSLSSMLGVSGGIEPIYANYYERKTESLHGHDEYYKVYTPIVKKYMEEHNIKDDSELPDFFVTAQTLDYKERIEMQGIWQDHIDASISSTVNVPNDFTVEDVEDLYMRAWARGLKGITLFRDGCKRVPILSTEDANDDMDDAICKPSDLPRGYIIKADDNCIGKKRTLITGCGTLHCEAFFDPISGDLLETYFSKGSSGGCHNFMIGLSRMISIACRGGVDIYSIVDQLKSSGVCPSYAVRRATKHDTSKGSCCPVAIGNALIDMYEELQNELGLVEEKEATETEKKDKTNSDKTNPQNSNISTKIKGKPKCPECGEPLIFEGGCNICKSCGWSKCD